MHRNASTPGGKPRWICRPRNGSGVREYCYSSTAPEKGLRGRAEVKKPPVFKRKLRETKRFLVTAAQNATPVHAEFLASLKTAAKHLDAEIIVIPIRYKNATSVWTASQKNEEWWDPRVEPYLLNQRVRLNRNLVVLADVSTQPTAQDPLSSFEAITADESGILGHMKLRFKSVATPQSKMPKILTTTGACTKPNYTKSKAGKLGEFHHVLGACLVELDGGRFHLRQINARKSDGSFIDLDKVYYPDRVEQAGRAAALVMGDWHSGLTKPEVIKATFGEGGMVPTLRPKVIVWHDLFDCSTVNPHDRRRGDIFIEIAKWRAGVTDVRKEATQAVRDVVDHTPPDSESWIAWSNHNDMLRQWLIDVKRPDPKNAAFYYELSAAMEAGARWTKIGAEYPDPFIWYAEKLLKEWGVKNVKCLHPGVSHSILGIAVDMHGHKGTGGSRGSIKNLARIGTRSFIAHGHGPGIFEGCSQVGTSTEMTAAYAVGSPGNWLNTHGSIDERGKRTLLSVIDEDWRLK